VEFVPSSVFVLSPPLVPCASLNPDSPPSGSLRKMDPSRCRLPFLPSLNALPPQKETPCSFCHSYLLTILFFRLLCRAFPLAEGNPLPFAWFFLCRLFNFLFPNYSAPLYFRGKVSLHPPLVLRDFPWHFFLWSFAFYCKKGVPPTP